MRRCDFIKVITRSAVAWPLAARTQQNEPVRLGYLQGDVRDDPAARNLRRQFVLGMRDLARYVVA